MGKRKGANGRKKKGGETRGRRTMPFAALLFVAIAIAGCVMIGRYGPRLQALVHRLDGLKTAMAQQVEIQGAVQVVPEELVRRSGIVFPVSLDQLKKVHLAALQDASPWIDKIKIIRVRNGRVVIGISERKPVAMLQSCGTQAGAVYLVDACGVCLPLGAGAVYQLPLVSGLQDSTGGDGIRRITAAGVVRMNRFFNDVAAAGDAAFANKITQLHFGRAPLLRVMHEGSITVVVINENDIAGCMENYTGIRETIRNDSQEPLRIDLAYRNLAFVTPNTVSQSAGAGESIAKKTKG
jgi:hypothetical protein